MSLETGTRLGSYEIVAPIGAGGMGEVYRARDTTLGREVAIKVLPGGLTEVAERLERFEREAKLLASLNHPGIATLHGFFEADGTRFLVMELVPGETLATQLERGPIPTKDVLRFAHEIAAALDYAHQSGVIHRDLKPANIKLTGRRAFEGDTASDVLTSVIKLDPDWSRLPADADVRVRSLLQWCLEKDRKKRRRDIGDVANELENVMSTPALEATGTGQKFPWRAVLLAGACVFLGAVLAALTLRPSAEVSSPMRFTLTLPEDVRLSGVGRRAVALSPDGRKLAYSAANQIYVRDLERLEAQVLDGTDGGRDLAFSPDGQWIAFWTDQGGLEKVAVSGGAPLTLCSTEITYGVSWDTDETIYYGQGPDGIFRVSADGGDPELSWRRSRARKPVFRSFCRPRIICSSHSVAAPPMKVSSSSSLLPTGSGGWSSGEGGTPATFAPGISSPRCETTFRSYPSMSINWRSRVRPSLS